MLRILIIVNGGSMIVAVLRTGTWAAVPYDFMVLATLVQPVLLLILLTLYALSPRLATLSYSRGIAVVLAIVLLAASAGYLLGGWLPGSGEQPDLLRFWVVSLVTAGVLIGYFDLRGRALSPALTEARLQALQARIRPHFLFNSITAVLSLIRSNPKQAEAALEDMAELFRVVMSDSRKLSRLGREVALCRQYLQLEQLRLGDRLQVDWHVENMPDEALVPPMVLQPLVENAVYHGIEPAAGTGVVGINIYRSRDEVHVVIRNPYQDGARHAGGSRMALDNIRERLALHFDAEASLDSQVVNGHYQVHIALPYLTEALG
jgi:two-component system, LytTR family, sensor histidine kinase AlgZ